ncbi:MAG TPA: YicC/YloC family endoribonuclease [Bacteroidia bacterium]|nr:YicC/YloC family endoribonuclease [Bacteroidia bacterium]
MLLSMTGYGTASAGYKGKTISAELKSVNGKFADVNVRLPFAYRDKETEIRNNLAKKFERGKIEFYVAISGGPKSTSVINDDTFESYYKTLKALEKKFKLPPTDYLRTILSFPETTKPSEAVQDEKEWASVIRVMEKAEKAFENFRRREGELLEKDFVVRINTIQKLLVASEPLAAKREMYLRNKIESGLSELIASEKIDRNRLEQEMIFYIERMDFTEEKIRLKEHCDYFILTMEEKISSGKKLSFITQEIGREINTIGAKANDAGIQKIVIQMKDELEKIREQLMNVL